MQIVAYLAYLVHLALADTNCFINPNYNGTVTLLPYRLNPVWNIGETQVIRWLTNLTSYNVTLWQQGIKDPGAALAAIVFGLWSSNELCIGLANIPRKPTQP